jgi:hypothetical protein
MMPKASAEKEAYWRSVVRRQERSGLSVRQFCREEQLSEASFYGWKRKIASRDRHAGIGSERKGRKRSRAQTVTKPGEKAAVFVPVRLKAAASGVLEIVHPRGHVVRVPAVFDEDFLRQVLRVLDGQRGA